MMDVESINFKNLQLPHLEVDTLKLRILRLLIQFPKKSIVQILEIGDSGKIQLIT